MSSNQDHPALPADLENALAAAATISQAVAACLELLEGSPYRLFIGERLMPLRHCLFPALVPKILASKDDEFRYVAAALCLPEHSEFAVPILMELFERDYEVCFIAGTLAKNNVLGAVPALIRRLGLSLSRPLNDKNRAELDIAICLVHSLRRFGAVIPQELIASMSDPKIPWQLRALLVSDPPRSEAGDH